MVMWERGLTVRVSQSGGVLASSLELADSSPFYGVFLAF